YRPDNQTTIRRLSVVITKCKSLQSKTTKETETVARVQNKAGTLGCRGLSTFGPTKQYVLPVAPSSQRFRLFPPDTVARGRKSSWVLRLPITQASQLARALKLMWRGRSVEARQTPSVASTGGSIKGRGGKGGRLLFFSFGSELRKKL
ncbi:hypothetical protein AVEN_164449-1, partial [Araneus ventricosus]